MKAIELEVTLNNVGKVKLEKSLVGKVLIPIPDSRNPAGWATHFNSKWPTGKTIMEQVEYDDALLEGLKVLARRQTVARMQQEYRDAHPNENGATRGRRSKQEIVDLPIRK